MSGEIRVPNVASPEELRNAIRKLLANVKDYLGSAAADITAADIANWNEAHSRQLSYDSDLDCLTNNI